MPATVHKSGGGPSLSAPMLERTAVALLLLAACRADVFPPSRGLGVSSFSTQPKLDLAVTKIASAGSAKVGDTIVNTNVVTNGGPASANGVVAGDTLPSGESYLSSAATVGSYNPGTGIWTIDTLAAGGSANLTLNARVTASASAALINRAVVGTPNQNDTNPNNNVALASTAVPAGASNLVFTTQPPSTTVGASFGAVVTAQTSSGATATSFSGQVTVSLVGGRPGAHLSGTKTVAAVGGVASFGGLSIDSAGTGYTLSTSASGVTGGTSAPFNIGSGAASQLAFTTQPPSTTPGATFTVAVTARDALGNTATSYGGNVTVAIGANPGGGALSGTTTVTATSGVATFTGLSINNLGNGYTLAASASGLPGAISAPFSIASTDEPQDPGSGYLWADPFDRYASVAAMQSDGTCGDGNGNAQTVYGQRTEANNSVACIVRAGYYLIQPGRTGSGQALRDSVHADPQQLQQSYEWLSPWPLSLPVYSGQTIVVQIWFRVSLGGTPGTAGCKWMMLWDATGNRGEFSPYNGTMQRPLWTWTYSNPGGVNRTQQPVGPFWDQINDGQWHRATFLYRTNTSSTYHYVSGTTSATEVYTGSSSRDGRVAYWLDGQKIVDFSQATVGVTPPGGLNPWAYQGDVDAIPTLKVQYLKFPGVFNGAPVAFTVDFDDLKIWSLP